MGLAVPLTLEQIEAASLLHARSVRWRHVDHALDQLRETLPGFRPEITLIKAVAINALYGTNVLAIARVAEHVGRVLGSADLTAAGPALVEELAAVPRGGAERRPRRRYSLAAKFAHFFIDPARFPIFDSYAANMVSRHLGRAQTVQDDQRRYVAFVKNVEALELAVGFRGARRELDRYLWIAGQYRRWSRDPGASINGELRRLFEDGGEELEFLDPGPTPSGAGRRASPRPRSGGR